MTMREYVSGFLLDPETGQVTLIRKNRPDWQAGRLNAIGGKVEPGELPRQAMRREFREETGVDIEAWEHFATLHDHTGTVTLFRHFDTTDALSHVTSTTDEHVEVHDVAHPSSRLLPAITWLLPLAFYRHGDFKPVVFTETENALTRTAGASA